MTSVFQDIPINANQCTVFSLIEAPGAKTRFKGASIYSNKCTTFQNKHDKEKAERLIRNLSIIQDEK